MIPQYRLRLCRLERRHVDLPIVRSLHQGGSKAGPEINNEQRRGADHRIGERFDELFARCVDPMQIIDQNNGDDVAGSGTHKRSDKIEQLRLSRFGVEFERCLVRVGEAQKLQQDQQQLIGDRKTGQPIDDAAARHIGPFFRTQAKDIAKQLQYRLKRGCPAVSKDPRLINADAFAPAIFRKFETEAALADSSFTNNANDATITLAGIFQFKRERGRLVGSAGQGAQSLSTPEHPTGGGMLKSPQFEYFNGHRQPPNRLHAKRFNFHELFGGRVGLFRN